jgi:hypothetical protein
VKKEFRTDFDFFFNKVKSKTPFALSRNNDGEMIILNNEYINLLDKCNGEFVFNPNDPQHSFFRERLLDSAKHKGDNYYVGIACRCCVGDSKHEALKALTEQDEAHLTWGNIFVNGNYQRYIFEMVPYFALYDIIMVVNKKANFENLPFKNKIIERIDVGTNAWIEDYHEVEFMKHQLHEKQYKNKLFLFAAGPFSNILIHELYKLEPNNTYLDIGSTLDVMMGLGQTRGYLGGAPTLSKICIW